MNPEAPINIAAMLQQVADEFNKGVEQAKRVRECKTRRFSYMAGPLRTLHNGVVFPSSHIVIIECSTGLISIFTDLKHYDSHYNVKNIQWIDPEPVA